MVMGRKYCKVAQSYAKLIKPIANMDTKMLEMFKF